jgi:hypothetical protein
VLTGSASLRFADPPQHDGLEVDFVTTPPAHRGQDPARALPSHARGSRRFSTNSPTAAAGASVLRGDEVFPLDPPCARRALVERAVTWAHTVRQGQDGRVRGWQPRRPGARRHNRVRLLPEHVRGSGLVRTAAPRDDRATTNHANLATSVAPLAAGRRWLVEGRRPPAEAPPIEGAPGLRGRFAVVQDARPLPATPALTR